MRLRHFAGLAGTVAATACGQTFVPVVITTAAAAPCTDIEIVYARGTSQPPGVVDVGKDFVDAVRAKVGPRSVGAYGVVYPASTDFPRTVEGVRDAARHIEERAADCPATKLVLAGYSQGAAVIGFLSDDTLPGGVDPSEAPKPVPAGVADHVAAVVLIGKPDPQFMATIDQPAVTIGPLYAAKTLELCAPGDPVCSDGQNSAAHTSYTPLGLTDQGAAFVAARV